MNELIPKISISVNDTIRKAMQVIDQGELGFALIIETETKVFKGVITDGDVRRALIKGYGLETSISSISRPESVTARIGTPISEVSRLFSDIVRIIPLLDDNNRVVDLAIFDKRFHLSVAEPTLTDKELQYVTECVLTGWVSSAGEFVSRFEKIFSDYCGIKHAVATSSGTAALHLALVACNIGPGDEVIVPSLTFIATANAVSYTGAKPVFVDIESETWNIDPECIETAITSKTKAIIPVHLYGHPANMQSILEIANRFGLLVIEDAAEAHGAMCRGGKVGTFGNIGIFSFYGNKIVTTGEGGMVVTNDDELAEKIRILCNHGMDKDRRYWHQVLGYNYRLTNVQAALGVAQMEKIDEILQKKCFIGRKYTEFLQNIPGLTLPVEKKWAKSVLWIYSILVDEKKFGITRDKLMEKLSDHDIETRPFFYPLHTQPIYKTAQKLAVAERVSSQGISLPSSVNLSVDDIKRVAESIKAIADT
jgi:perosamine synthetase